MKRFNGIAAIDVGTTKVCTIMAETRGSGGLRVVGLGITPSKGMHKGMVVSIGDAREAIIESVRMAEQSCNYKVESAYVGVTGRHVTSTNNHGVVAITRNDRLVRPDDLRRVLASAQSLRVPEERKLLHVITRNISLDGQEGVKNPVGMHGIKLDVETHVITAAVTSLQNLVKCIRGIGIDVDDLVLEPLASSEAVLTEEEKQQGVILADIGGGTTDVAIFRNGSIWHTSVIAVAGYQFTRDIAIGLGMPFDVAEQMKKKYGTVQPVYEGKADEAATEIARDSHGFSYQDLCGILRVRAEELLKLIRLEVPGDSAKIAPMGLVLTGGSSNLAGLAKFGTDTIRMPVRIGAPKNLGGMADKLVNPAYATSVGIVLWAAGHESTGDWRYPRISVALKSLASRFARLFR